MKASIGQTVERQYLSTKIWKSFRYWGARIKLNWRSSVSKKGVYGEELCKLCHAGSFAEQ